jgi:prolyl-tRNA editing enzyme YbaK/EbsC (Cys-tRNA(Pro) deacylase)
MERIATHQNVQAVEKQLRDVGFEPRVKVLADSAPTAAGAAEQIGCTVGAIANSLIFDADGVAILILTSGAHRVDTVKAAQAAGVAALKRASAEFVRTHTGQPIGGVAPLGHPAPVRTFVDEALRGHPEVWAAAGHPHTVFPITFDELVRVTGAEIIAVD